MPAKTPAGPKEAICTEAMRLLAPLGLGDIKFDHKTRPVDINTKPLTKAKSPCNAVQSSHNT
jgi:hypothetical protein